ncbi:hypothetical protein NRB56_64470 [Nocardia sp. RB56]|uniref:Uncharacterized protein n=2 Tax=Nocardia aurantia TaxID=2585199 RepID=A0A7K0DYG7_9NOCA|nr:hypothetical protein [Nocardia aurantia]
MAGYAACNFAMAGAGGGERHAETVSTAAHFDTARRGGPGRRCPLARGDRRAPVRAPRDPAPPRPRPERPAAPEPSLEPLAEPALGVGVVMLLAALVCAPRIPLWADDYGVALVYLALFIHLALAVGAVRWGLRIRREHRTGRPRPPGRETSAADESDEPRRRASSPE